MTSALSDKTGAPVTIRLDEGRPISSYTVHLADGTLGGRVDFIDGSEDGRERIIFHTEVAPELSGRGLSGLLVGEALADSIREDLTVVPVCPLFAAHLEDHGAEFVAEGGRFRVPTTADIAAVRSALAGDA